MKTIQKKYQKLDLLLTNITKDFPSSQKDWKQFEQNHVTIALNILFVPHNIKTIRLAYKSKYNQERENQVVLLITDGKK